MQIDDPGWRAEARAGYLRLLTWAFTLFSTARMCAYLPTLLAIHASGDSSQHSLWTWGHRAADPVVPVTACGAAGRYTFKR